MPVIRPNRDPIFDSEPADLGPPVKVFWNDRVLAALSMRHGIALLRTVGAVLYAFR